jgi:DNA-binding NarL/FixJ family response regulator
VLAGEVYLSTKTSSDLLRKFSRGRPSRPVEVLANRELQVFRLIGRGLSTRSIAKKLSLSVKTVETYRSNIKGKLFLKNHDQLLQAAVEWVLSGTEGE